MATSALRRPNPRASGIPISIITTGVSGSARLRSSETVSDLDFRLIAIASLKSVYVVA